MTTQKFFHLFASACLATFIAGNAVAHTSLAEHSRALARAAGCPVDGNDPFSAPELMPSGPYKGSCIDPHLYRSVRRLTAAERAEFGIDPNARDLEVVANFHHKNRYWVAVIPKGSVQDLVFQLSSLFMGLPIYHGQIRVRLKPGSQPVTLIEQTKLKSRRSFPLKQDIVLALFAARAKGHEGTFNPIAGLADEYANAYTLGSVDQETDKDKSDRTPYMQYHMHLTRPHALAALEDGINRGTERGMQDVYNTLSSSCLNMVFWVINRVLGQTVGLTGDQIASVIENIDPLDEMRNLGLIGAGESSRIEDY